MKTGFDFAAVALGESSLVESLKYVRISGRIAQCSNGVATASAPVETDLDAAALGRPFLQALKVVDDPTFERVKDSVVIKGNSTKVKVLAIDVEPYEGRGKDNKMFVLNGFLKVLKKVRLFCATDQGVAWAQGVYLKGNVALATDSRSLVAAQTSLSKCDACDVVIPVTTIDLMLSIDEEPLRMDIEKSGVRFIYSGNRELFTSTIDQPWPDMTKLFKDADFSKCVDIPETFFQQLKKLRAFLDASHTVTFIKSCATTSNDKSGIVVDIDEAVKGKFDHTVLMRLEGVAEKFDLSVYPEPSPFIGDKVKGVFIGMV